MEKEAPKEIFVTSILFIIRHTLPVAHAPTHALTRPFTRAYTLTHTNTHFADKKNQAGGMHDEKKIHVIII